MGTTSLLILTAMAAGVWAAFFLAERTLVMFLGSAGLFSIAVVSFVNDMPWELAGFCVLMGVIALARGAYRMRRDSRHTKE